MTGPVNSNEPLLSNQSANVARSSKQIPGDKNKVTNNFKRTQPINRDPTAHGSTQSDWPIKNHQWHVNNMYQQERDTDKSHEEEKRKEKPSDDRTRNSRSKRETNSRGKQRKGISLWCAKCCKKRKRKRTDPGKRKIRRFFERCWKKNKKPADRKTSPNEQSSISTIQQQESVDEASKSKRERKRRKHEKRQRSSKDRRTSLKEERYEQKEKRKGSDLSVSDGSVHYEQQDEKFTKDHISGQDVPDFRKSCCYLCTKNTMAIAEAMAGKAEKSDRHIQVSAHQFFKETYKTDKSCSPMLQVRTVQSSVRVKTRERSTLCPEIKEKRTKPKSKSKRFSILPKIKRSKYPGTKTVACGTDKPIKRDNKVKCVTIHGQCCATGND